MPVMLKKIKWFWPWEDEKEETWLREMSRQGWRLATVKSFGRYAFNQGDKRDDLYYADFELNKKDLENNRKQLQDSGWEYIGGLPGRQYYRRPAERCPPAEITANTKKKLVLYQHIITYLVVFSPIYTVIFFRVFNTQPYPWWEIIRFIVFILVLLWAYVMVRLFLRLLQLTKK